MDPPSPPLPPHTVGRPTCPTLQPPFVHPPWPSPWTFPRSLPGTCPPDTAPAASPYQPLGVAWTPGFSSSRVPRRHSEAFDRRGMWRCGAGATPLPDWRQILPASRNIGHIQSDFTRDRHNYEGKNNQDVCFLQVFGVGFHSLWDFWHNRICDTAKMKRQ